MPIANFKYSDITQKVIGTAMTVHNKLGCGFQEIIYQRALSIQLDKVNLNYAREARIPIHFESQEIGTRRVDFIVEENIMLELKAVTQLENIHLAQALNYLETFDLETGLLINFGSKSLEFKRLISKKHKVRVNPE